MVTRLVIEHLNDKKQRREEFQQNLKEEGLKQGIRLVLDANPNLIGDNETLEQAVERFMTARRNGHQ